MTTQRISRRSEGDLTGTSADLFLSVMLGEGDLFEVQALVELNLLNRPALEAYVAGFGEQITDLKARKIFQKQAVSHLSNSDKDARQATVGDLEDGPVAEWILKCRDKGQEIHVFERNDKTDEVLGLMTEYLNANPAEAIAPYAYAALQTKVLEYHLHPDAKVQKDFHDFTKVKQSDGTILYTLAPVAEWEDVRKARDERRALSLAAQNVAIQAYNLNRPQAEHQREKIPDGPPVTIKLLARGKLVIAIDSGKWEQVGQPANPSNSTEMRDCLDHLIKREHLDIMSSMPRVAKLSGGHEVIGLFSNAARDYATFSMKNCVGLSGNYDSGCTTYAIVNSADEMVVCIATNKADKGDDEALGFANEKILGVTRPDGKVDYRWELYLEFCNAPGLRNITLVTLANGQQVRLDKLLPGSVVVSKIDLSVLTRAVLPDNLEARGGLVLGRMAVPVLPSGLKVTGSLVLRATGVTELPAGLMVTEILDIRGTGVSELPEDLVAKDLRATRETLDQDSAVRWFLRKTVGHVQDSYAKHLKNESHALTDAQVVAKFEKEISPKVVEKLSKVQFYGESPPAPGSGRADLAHAAWMSFQKIFV